jgi:hypothetical protein
VLLLLRGADGGQPLSFGLYPVVVEHELYIPGEKRQPSGKYYSSGSYDCHSWLSSTPIADRAVRRQFQEKMELALANDECPTNYKLEAVLPGAQKRF